MTNKKDYQISLRRYFVILYLIIFLITSLFGMATIVFLKEYLHVTGSFTLWLLIYSIAILILGALIMWFGSTHLTKPISDLNQSVKAISQGDFSRKIVRKSYPKDRATYHNEIDELSQNINQMADDIKNADRHRSQFIANLSHELKTPISSLVGISDLLLTDSLEKDTRTELTTILQSESLRLSRLCDDILNLTKLENHLSPQLESVALDEQIRQALIMLTEKWKNKTIHLEFNGEAVMCQTDPDLTMQVWVNVIDNAIKYSSDQVFLNVDVKQATDKVLVTISDKGIGIAKENQRHIFEQFYQADQSHAQEGNGLGLAIVKKIIDSLNGSIHFESTPGQGSRFYITLPTNQ
ncbi:HAMP domain-containing histidine kinase [Streptococcus uberis]|uniref:HAMP domain-containing sensor histidine kinase n=1 Tax=Streptococcus uberis TaxID=1349 RepID=UPI0027DDCC56|nr:HAMP domain-containing sensor histidine kinase [Streptococcus uberis]MCK1204382.1 HAMP domain-containing histidine kinase [Streptococcus uberis]MCK1253696.1 HAMP domain-containing histidine kinase [Streptococcus uberis]